MNAKKEEIQDKENNIVRSSIIYTIKKDETDVKRTHTTGEVRNAHKILGGKMKSGDFNVRRSMVTLSGLCTETRDEVLWERGRSSVHS